MFGAEKLLMKRCENEKSLTNA
ncbi:MAG: hypothetical protein ACLUP7_02220 [Eubacterium sp.]